MGSAGDATRAHTKHELGRSGRQIKFTPERIEEIKKLVERGKSRKDIAELIGVTVGSLQVPCSRLGVSLRRPIINKGTQPRLKPAPTPPSTPAKAADVARFAITMRYRGEERTTELPLTQDMITQLAVEAAFRGVPIGDLIGDLIVESLETAQSNIAGSVKCPPIEGSTGLASGVGSEPSRLDFFLLLVH